MRNFRLLLVTALAVLAFAARGFGQGSHYENIALKQVGPSLVPAGGATIGVCSTTGLATTAASVSGNVAVLTMASNPQTAGFVVGGPITVSGFSGADLFFNGSYTLTAVSSTSLSYSLAHANATASTNGAVTQAMSASGTCAPYISVFSDSALSVPVSQPLHSDAFGNYSFWAAPGLYVVSISGNGLIASSSAISLPCTTNSTCAGSVTSFSAGNLSPLFTSSVATPTTTPALSFSLSSAAPITVFGNCSGTTGAPAFCSITGNMLPFPSPTTVGGVQSFAAVAHQWINAISTSGVPSATQPAFSDISGTASTSQIGTGTPAASKYVDGGTGAWTALPTSGLSETTNSQTNLAVTSTGDQLITILTPGSNSMYHVMAIAVTVTAGVGCTTQATYSATIHWTDGLSSVAQTFLSASATTAVVGNGAKQPAFTAIYAKAAVAIQAGINVQTAASGCTTNPLVSVQMEALP